MVIRPERPTPRRARRSCRLAPFTALAALALTLLAAAPADARDPLTVVVVLDTSGSMAAAGHDPNQISKFAVEVLAAFLADDDRLGVVPLGGATAAIPPTRLADLRPTLADQLAAIPIAGGTPCHTSLDAARAMLTAARPPPGAGSVVLLTDGVCHEGDRDKPTKDAATLATAAALRADGVPLFGVPLGADADLAFVRELSAGTELDWTLARVDQARQLPALFAALSAALQRTEARATPLSRGAQTLELDPYLRSVTLLATVDGGDVSIARLADPSGERAAVTPIEGRFPKNERRRQRTSGYSILKLTHPEPGPWTVQVTAAADPSAVIVYDYDLRAALEIRPADASEGADAAPRPGQTVTARATLRTPAGDPVDARFLEGASASLQIRGPNDAAWRDLGPLTWDGVAWFTAAVPLADLGRHRLRAQLTRGHSLDLRTTLDVTTAPGLRLVAPTGPCLAEDAARYVAAPIVADDGDHAALDAAFAALDARLWAAPGPDAELEPVARLPWDPAARAFAGDWAVPAPGAWVVEARLSAGPGVTARSAPVSLSRVHFALALPSDPVEFGTFKAGGGARAEVPWQAAATSHDLLLSADTSRAVLPEGARLEVVATPPAPGADPADAPDDVPAVAIRLDTDDGSPGGAVGGVVTLTASHLCAPDGAVTLEVPLRGEIVPLTFWERLANWVRDNPGVIIGLGVLLLLLLYLLKVVLCMRRTHAFDDTLSVAVGEGLRSFTEPRRLRDHTGARRKVALRCRHARLYWNVHDDNFGDTRDRVWWLEATRDGGARLVLPDGATAESASEATRQFNPLPTPADLHRGVIYKVGDVTFKLV